MAIDLVNAVELDADVFDAEHSADFEGESATMEYRIFLKSSVAKDSLQLYNSHKILAECNLVNPTIFPRRGGAWPVDPLYGWYAQKFTLRRTPKKRHMLACTISFGPYPPGKPNTENSNGNPLFFPATYDLEYIENEEVITEAYNVEKFGKQTKKGERAALTKGPVTNSAHQEPDEGIIEVMQNPVLVIYKNVPDLSYLITLNNTYRKTTNSDIFLGAPIRTAKWLGAISQGEQMANGFKFYRMMARIEIKDTTDFAMNNVGFHYYRLRFGGVHELTKFQVEIPPAPDDPPDAPTVYEDVSEPRFLNLDGEKPTDDAPVHLHWRYLREVSYVPLANL